jgi:hypothetical protein
LFGGEIKRRLVTQMQHIAKRLLLCAEFDILWHGSDPVPIRLPVRYEILSLVIGKGLKQHAAFIWETSPGLMVEKKLCFYQIRNQFNH